MTLSSVKPLNQVWQTLQFSLDIKLCEKIYNLSHLDTFIEKELGFEKPQVHRHLHPLWLVSSKCCWGVHSKQNKNNKQPKTKKQAMQNQRKAWPLKSASKSKATTLKWLWKSFLTKSSRRWVYKMSVLVLKLNSNWERVAW